MGNSVITVNLHSLVEHQVTTTQRLSYGAFADLVNRADLDTENRQAPFLSGLCTQKSSLAATVLPYGSSTRWREVLGRHKERLLRVR